MDVRMLTVGPVAENCYVLRGDGATEALVVDPGDEAPKILRAIEALGVQVAAILLTHCHFDHIGAVAPVAVATGAPVYCPALEVPMLQSVAAYTPLGFGPFASWDPEQTVAGGEKLTLAGLDIDVHFLPGHSPGHVAYALDDPAATMLFSGDVLFQGSIGRTDLPGSEHAALLRSLVELLERFDDDTVVHPGHMGLTTIGRERATNPFLVELSGT